MVIVLSYVSALECVRTMGMSEVFAGPRERRALPRVAPTASELSATLARTKLDLTEPIHLLAGAQSAHKVTSHMNVHSGVAPTGIIRLTDELYCMPPEAFAIQLARGIDDVELAMLLMELLGAYAIQPRVEHGMFRRTQAIMTEKDLASVLAAGGRMRGVSRVRRVAALVAPGSASPMESKLYARVEWPFGWGGYEVPVGDLNGAFVAPRLGSGAGNERFFDLPLGMGPTPQIDLEYNGRVHATPEGVRRDGYRRNDLTARGVPQYTMDKAQYDNEAYFDDLLLHIRDQLGLPAHDVDEATAAFERGVRRALYEKLERYDGLTCFGLGDSRSAGAGR